MLVIYLYNQRALHHIATNNLRLLTKKIEFKIQNYIDKVCLKVVKNYGSN